MFKSVLIIDDSDIDRLIATTLIKKNMFAENIMSFNNVVDGLKYLKSLIQLSQKFPEIIFLDVNMPVSDGFDFLDGYLEFSEEIRNSSTIFMISATNSPNDLKRIKTYTIVRQFFNKPLTQGILRIIRETAG